MCENRYEEDAVFFFDWFDVVWRCFYQHSDASSLVVAPMSEKNAV